jgi:hypothetical protein
MSDDKLASSATTESRSGRGFFGAWILAYVLPALAILLIRQSLVQRQQDHQQQVRNEEIRTRLESIPPEQMGEATRMLMGLDEVPAKADASPIKVDQRPTDTPETP